jgi:uncharacterized membrane protein HdeD (DUF308 family)
MSSDSQTPASGPTPEFAFGPAAASAASRSRHELQHLKQDWWWLLLLGGLLIVCGAVALAYPLISSVAAVIFLGATLIVGGVATIISALWAGKWSALLLQLLVGILYVVAGIVIMDTPVESAMLLTLFIAAFFIVVGAFRAVAALALRFPQWGWSLLNGVITLLAGIIIYKHFPEAALWVIGLLVGIELLFNGWTWVMVSLVLRKLPTDQPSQEAAAQG